MSNINEIIGMNIRRMRKSMGLTIEQLVALIQEMGYNDISSYMLGSWERGGSDISAANLVRVAHVLHCSVDTLCTNCAPQDGVISEIPPAQCEFIAISERSKETMMYARRVWDGNSKALAEFNRMYIVTPRPYRQEMAGAAIADFKRLVREHRIRPALDVDLRFLETQCEAIYK